jgi:hypothetical protein
MTEFKVNSGTRSAHSILKTSFNDIAAFNAVVQTLVLENPIGCVPYMQKRKYHPPVEIVREQYTAKFVYLDKNKKQIGIGLDRYDTVEGYENGIAAVISNMANLAAHGGKVKHVQKSDLFSVLMQCHDPSHGLYFISLGRDRISISSYADMEICRNVERWTKIVPELE